MSADILPFPPVRASSGSPAPARRCVPGDIVVTCINATVGLWAAWPVLVVDDDGVVAMVASRSGQRIAAERVSCDPACFGVARRDHEAGAFDALRWRTWNSTGDAMASFAAICTAPGSASGPTGGAA